MLKFVLVSEGLVCTIVLFSISLLSCFFVLCDTLTVELKSSVSVYEDNLKKWLLQPIVAKF